MHVHDSPLLSKNDPKPNLRYGWLSYYPKWLQHINRPLYFVFWVCVLVIFQGALCTGISNVVLTSIEKRYGFKSTEVALFNTFYHLAAGIWGPFAAYIGHRHRPRMLAATTILLCVGAVIVTVPHFISKNFISGGGIHSDLCNQTAKLTTENCVSDSSDSKSYLLIMVTGYFILGLGGVPIYVLGAAHICDVSKHKKNLVYLTAMILSSLFGPSVGYSLGKVVLAIYVDIKQPIGSQLTPSDDSWVGAWWIGFLIGAVLLLIPTIPLLGFSKHFPNTEEIRKTRNLSDDFVAEKGDLNHDLKSVLPAIKSLLLNSTFVFICLSNAGETLMVGGFATFLPKLIETQFNFSPANAALYTGFIVIPGAACGVLLGGYLPRRLSWNCKQTLKGATVMALLGTLLMPSVLIGCPGQNMVGSLQKQSDTNSSKSSDFNSNCIGSCFCSTKHYKPICTNDGRTFFSPCHAGCFGFNTDAKIFTNCSCFSGNMHEARLGRCSHNCNRFPYFVLASIFMICFIFMNNVPILHAVFRVVPEGQGTFAMGFQQVFSRFLGFIPAPTIFGKMIDMTCKSWKVDECTGETTSCLEYNNAQFRLHFMLLGVICKLASLIFIYIAYKLYKSPSEKRKSMVQVPTEEISD